MAKIKKLKEMAVFGNIKLARIWCDDCKINSLVVKGFKQCCDKPENSILENFKIECQPEDHRRYISKKVKEDILIKQNHRCFYCEKSFGGFVYKNGKAIHLKIAWDHFCPFDYCRDNNPTNFVAACHICNSLKSNYIFQTVDEAKIKIGEKYKEKGYL